MSDDLHQTASGKRRDVISWDEFFMSVAKIGRAHV